MNTGDAIDWDDAYSNFAYIPGGYEYPAKWLALAAQFREEMKEKGLLKADLSYGQHARNRLDLFMPWGDLNGLAVFVHGGYWMEDFDKSAWSHLAKGAVANGFAVAVPSYALCPEVRISDITVQVGSAITRAASEVAGPIHLTGHSAGGHLVARMVSSTSPLAHAVRHRIRKTVPISALVDLRPLMKTEMNETLHLDAVEARLESPALLEPQESIDVTAWVGAGERPEFVRQNALLANIWSGFDCRVEAVEEPGRHHADIIEGLMEPDHPLTRKLLCL
ncbi:alpha/beta hydrolase (plasmid) [Phyllobacterium zundukense]|uniref:alpha/beta hydrolase n=1 Tax=Phyllobacterium zundukense TaxID=1867719 RepID=UPI000C1C4C22|nr:alpha/beta hydrolase [Phyllobacterium zundukense]ATU95962.1 alpha/beta hydrolase [Phyllobacterium zundukense]